MNHTEEARRLFLAGYNCAQAVFCAFCDETGLDIDTAARLSSSFGGGMGRLREVCGAVSAASMVLGLAKGYDRPGDPELKKRHYELVREFAAAPRKQLAHVLPALLPASLAEVFPALCGLPGDRSCGSVTREERLRLGETLKALEIPVSRRRPLAEAIVTRGGVSVKEVRPGTMESKRVPGLYFAGELLDTDAHTGGFNLQIAWSTGFLAGRNAAAYALNWKE